MEVQHVHLQRAHSIQDALDRGYGIEPSPNVNHEATMDKLWRINDAEGRAIVGSKNLAERLEGITNTVVRLCNNVNGRIAGGGQAVTVRRVGAERCRIRGH